MNYTGQNSAGLDFHLKSSSPAIDRGDPQLGSQVTLPSPFKDIDGNTRPFDVPGVGTNGAGAFDIGAYEYGSSDSGDKDPPLILSVTASESFVEIQFNEALDGASAENAGNYSLSDGLIINSVHLDTGTIIELLYILIYRRTAKPIP